MGNDVFENRALEWLDSHHQHAQRTEGSCNMEGQPIGQSVVGFLVLNIAIFIAWKAHKSFKVGENESLDDQCQRKREWTTMNIVVLEMNMIDTIPYEVEPRDDGHIVITAMYSRDVMEGFPDIAYENQQLNIR